MDLSLDGVCQSDKGSEHTPGITIERRLQNTHTLLHTHIHTKQTHTHKTPCKPTITSKKKHFYRENALTQPHQTYTATLTIIEPHMQKH